MRSLLLTILIIFIIALPALGQSPPYWFHYAGTNGYDEGMAIATDDADNVINVGYFSTTINFDITLLTSSGVTDGYIVKTTNSGAYLWAMKFGSNSDDRALGVCTDSLNNIYVTGYFSGTATFGSFILTSSGLQDAFVMKINPTGTVLWVSQCGGTGNDIGNGICIDHNGNIILTGQFRETAQFGSTSLTSMNDPLSGLASTDIFTTKLDGSGSFLWAKKGSAKYTDRGIDVSCDLSGNIYVTGQFSDTIEFDNVHNNSLFNAIFLIKYDPAGNEQWFNKIGAGSTTVVRSIKVDRNSDFFVSGECTIGTIFFGTPNVTITNPYPNRVFAAKYNSSGAVQWATANGSANAISAGDMAIDDSSNVYITGTFNCKLSDFSDYYGQGIFNSVGYKDIFTSRISSAGVWQWARQCGGPANDAASGIDLIGNTPVITGSFNNRFIYPSSPLYIHYEDAGIGVIAASTAPFCTDPLQGNFSQYLSGGVSDIYFGKAYDLSRMPYDYYNRTNSNCTLPFVGVCININGMNNLCSSDSTSACTAVNLFAGSNTSGTAVGDTMSGPGPTYNYLWNTSETTPGISVYSSGYYGVRITSTDGCFTSTDSIWATVNSKPPVPLISDNHLININALVTTKLKLCAPDTVILTASNTGNSNVNWLINGNVYNSLSCTYLAHADDSLVATIQVRDSNYCISSNWVTIVVDSALAPVLPVISVYEDTVKLCDGGNLQFQIHIYDSISDPTNSNYCGIPNANFIWSSVPYLNLFNVCNQGQVATTILNQAGTFQITCTMIRSSFCGGNDTTILSQPVTVEFYPPVVLTPPVITSNGSDTICPGSYIILTASGGNYFKWSGPSVPPGTSGPNLTVWSPGYYCATVFDTSALGCVTSAASCINVYTTSSPQIVVVPGNNVICPSDSVQLISPGAVNCEWIGPQGSFSTNDTAYSNIPGYYFCNVTNSTGCTLSTATIELIQYTTPIIVVTPSNIICPGDSVQAQVVASPSANIYWYAPFNSSNPIQYIDSAGVYVCLTESCNIIKEDSISIFQSNFTATINPVGPVNICEHDSVSLSGNPGMALYEWFPGNIIADSIYVNQSGNYFVAITDQYGCRDTSDTVSVNILNTPATPQISGNGPLCEGDSIQLITAFIPGVTYNWTGPNNFNSSSTNPVITNINLSNSGNYFLTLSNSQCPSLPDTAFIQVDSFPTAFTLSGTQLLCEGDTLMLATNPTFGSQGMWTIPGNQQIPGSTYFISSSTINNNGQYFYVISNQQCSRKDSITVQVNALPPVFNLSGTTPLCEGDSLSLSTSPNFGNQGMWTSPNNQTYTGSVYNLSATIIADSGIYYFIISNQNCSREDSIKVQVNAMPAAYTLSGTTSLCEGDSLSLSTSPNFGNQGTWTLPNNLTSSGSIYNLSGSTMADSGTYYFIISNQNCSRDDSISVQVNAMPPVFNLSGTTPLCEGDPMSIGTSPNFGNQGIWTFPNNQHHTGSIFTTGASSIADSGMYYFIISNQQCSREDSISIQVNSYPQTFTIEGNLSICKGEELALMINPDFGNQGIWYLPDNTTSGGSSYVLHQTDSANGGTYYYTISNAECSRTDSAEVIILSCNNFFPNVFTPNDDGVNDVFNASNVDMNVQSIKIFSRWGDNITEVKSGKGWDGTNKYGTKVPAGTYFYVALYLDGGNQEPKTATGFLELIR